MSPWTALLESLHSALIDEVTDRHPEPKPELGMPKRQSQFAFPSPDAASVLWVEVQLANTPGAAMIAVQPGFLKALDLSADQLWQSLVKRAGAEFGRREIRPVFSNPIELKPAAATPRHLSSLPRIVWIPIKLPDGSCWFGIAA